MNVTACCFDSLRVTHCANVRRIACGPWNNSINKLLIFSASNIATLPTRRSCFSPFENTDPAASAQHRAELAGLTVVLGTLMDRFGYVFDPEVRPVEGTTKPEARLHAFHPLRPVDVGGFSMLPLPVPQLPTK